MRPASAESMPQMQAYILHDIRKGQVSEMKKVILILVDGLWPDALETCGNPYGKELLQKSA